MTPLRTIFMGTAELACPSLEALAQSGACHLLAVVTQPDRPKGRDLKLHGSAVKALAAKLALPVLQPARARDGAFLEELARLAPHLIVVAAYGQLLPPAILDRPPFGCLNVHASLLPKYRGAAPIQWAILNDEVETGVTIMKMDPGLDTGPILTHETVPIMASDDARSLHDGLARLGAELLVRTIPGYVQGQIVPRPQPAQGASYARKITKEDGHLDWKQPARTLWNRVRALNPWPGAFTFHRTGPHSILLKICRAEPCAHAEGQPGEILEATPAGLVVCCGDQSLRILMLQREGGRKMTAAEYLNGHSLKSHDRLG